MRVVNTMIKWRALVIKKIGPQRLVYKSVDNCPFYLKIAKDKNKPGLKVKTYKNFQSCWHKESNNISCG